MEVIALCNGCSTPSSSSTSLPSYHDNTAYESEKEIQPFEFDCHHFVCARCQMKNRRLVRYCWKCEGVAELLGGKVATSDHRIPLTTQRNADAPGYEEGFVIGDDEEEIDAVGGQGPPVYGEVDFSTTVDRASADKENDVVKGEQGSIHYLRPEETLSGLALKYRLDVRPSSSRNSKYLANFTTTQGRLLCTLNRLPPSTLTTTPHLLHTLPFLVLPPHMASGSSTPLHSAAEERQRLVIRRFQVLEKISSYAEAKTYVDFVFAARRVEVDQIRSNRAARRSAPLTPIERDAEEEELQVREGGELEEARESWRKDREWENSQVDGGKGKGKAVVGSKLRSTGKVESAVKGWGFRN